MINRILKSIAYRSKNFFRRETSNVDIQPVQRPQNEIWLSNYAEIVKSLGINNIYITLSFDCDTPEDAVAAQTTDRFLSSRAIPRTYAVPGEMLTHSGSLYRKLFDDGAVFLNHGQRPHAEFRDGRYQSITFYNEMSEDEVIQDMAAADATLRNILGITPKGFRAPHFGYFQEPHQRALIYRTAKSLGYQFCSDTLPALGLKKGPVIDMGGIYEIPLSGSLADPHTILDSWNYLEDYVDFRLKDDYQSMFSSTIDFFRKNHLPALLNYYVDPAHVINSPCFFKAVDYALEQDAVFLDYEGLINLTSQSSTARIDS